MGSGSGTLAAKVQASAGDLAFGRVGGIVRRRVLASVHLLSVMFEGPNKSMNQLAFASLRPLVMLGVVRLGARGTR